MAISRSSASASTTWCATATTIACGGSRTPAWASCASRADRARWRSRPGPARWRATAARSSSRRPTPGRRCTGLPTWTTSASSASTPTAGSGEAPPGSTRGPATARTSATSRSSGAVEAVDGARPSRATATPRRRSSRSSTTTPATSSSRCPRRSCSRSPWASWPWASASACGRSSAATPSSASSVARLPAARPLQHAQPRARPGDPRRGLRRRERRLRAAALGVGPCAST